MQMKVWHPIPTEVLRAAREKRGWSYEGAARALGISSKTWERWEKDGRVPLDAVGNVIAALELDLEHPIYARMRIVAEDLHGVPPTTAEVLVIVRQTREAVEQLAAALRALSDRFPGGAPASSLSREEVAEPQ